jgi:hypothetical protein
MKTLSPTNARRLHGLARPLGRSLAPYSTLVPIEAYGATVEQFQACETQAKKIRAIYGRINRREVGPDLVTRLYEPLLAQVAKEARETLAGIRKPARSDLPSDQVVMETHRRLRGFCDQLRETRELWRLYCAKNLLGFRTGPITLYDENHGSLHYQGEIVIALKLDKPLVRPDKPDTLVRCFQYQEDSPDHVFPYGGTHPVICPWRHTMVLSSRDKTDLFNQWAKEDLKGFFETLYRRLIRVGSGSAIARKLHNPNEARCPGCRNWTYRENVTECKTCDSHWMCNNCRDHCRQCSEAICRHCAARWWDYFDITGTRRQDLKCKSCNQERWNDIKAYHESRQEQAH